MATETQKRLKARDESKAYRREPAPPKPLEAGPDAEEIYKQFVENARLLTTPGLLNSDGRMQRAAKFLSGSSPSLLERAAEEVGVAPEDLMASVERFEPGSVRKFGLQKKGISTSSEGELKDTRGPSGAPPSRRNKGKGKTEVDFDSKPRPTIEDALGVPTALGGVALGPGAREEVDNLRAVQRQFPTGENIAREAARTGPLDSWSRAEQYYEDLESTSDLLPFERKTKGAPLAEGEEGPKEMPAPRATYAGKGTGRPLGPGGKAMGTQEDFAAYRTQKTIDDAVAERNRQKRIKFLRAGGRMTADGKSIAVMPDFGQAPPPKEGRSGDYQYASEIRQERRAADEKLSRDRFENFKANLGEPATELGRKIERDKIREAEAEEFLKSTRDQIRVTENTARDLKRGNVRGGSADNLSDFFEDLDNARATKAQLRGKDQESQVNWARKELDARREEQKRLQEEEEEKRKRVAAASFQDVVTNWRNKPSYLDRY